MLNHLSDFERTFALMDEVRRRMGAWDEGEPDGPDASRAWPRISLFDAGEKLVLTADLPGIPESDLEVTTQNGGLVISGERKADAPEGYAVHRQERAAMKFARSVALPCKVNTAETSASLREGVLTITLPKALEAQPKQISIRAD